MEHFSTVLAQQQEKERERKKLDDLRLFLFVCMLFFVCLSLYHRIWSWPNATTDRTNICLFNHRWTNENFWKLPYFNIAYLFDISHEQISVFSKCKILPFLKYRLKHLYLCVFFCRCWFDKQQLDMQTHSTVKVMFNVFSLKNSTEKKNGERHELPIWRNETPSKANNKNYGDEACNSSRPM